MPTAGPTVRARLAAPNRRTITALIWDNGRVVKQRRREGIATGNSEFEANRFDMVRPITQERLGLLFDSEGWAWRIDNDGDLCGLWEGHLFCFRFLGDSREVLSIVAFMKQLVPLEYGGGSA